MIELGHGSSSLRPTFVRPSVRRMDVSAKPRVALEAFEIQLWPLVKVPPSIAQLEKEKELRDDVGSDET